MGGVQPGVRSAAAVCHYRPRNILVLNIYMAVIVYSVCSSRYVLYECVCMHVCMHEDSVIVLCTTL